MQANAPARRALALILLALAAALPAALRANMAEEPEPAPVRPGDELGEPAGGLRSVVVEHERLRIDLRPLARGRPATVEATYRTRNDGARRALRLLFVADGLGGEARVWLDGRPVPSRPAQPGPLPARWRAPATTPALDSGDALEYQARHAGALAFQLDLAPGRHEIRVRYPAEAAAYQTRELMPVWQLGYVLAPARDWGGFGELDVRVEVPRGWDAASEPALRRDGDALVGRWRGIPADALALSARAPEPSSAWRYGAWLAGCALGLWGCIAIGGVVGRSLGRRGRSAWWALPASCAVAMVWTFAAALFLLVIPGMIAEAAGPHANRYVANRMSYSTGWLLILVIPLLTLIGTSATQIAAIRARRAAGRPHPA
jgi:hypothetical protein